MAQDIYLGFDLSTQQCKGLAVQSDLKLVNSATVDFDEDFSGKYGVHKGVLSNPSEGEIYAPVAMWLESLDLVLSRFRKKGLDFSRIKGISGAGMQHGTVFWSEHAEHLLGRLNPSKGLVSQLAGEKRSAFSHPFSPNWQDASTEAQCKAFDSHLGTENALADITGSKAHHRFSGPQILRSRQKCLEKYDSTGRISLVSSFLASLLAGKIAPIDISDVCGMNLRDIKGGKWNKELLSLVAGSDDTTELEQKLGPVPEDGGGSIGQISPYFVDRYGFPPDCIITPFTGDNPSTILSLPLRSSDAMVSLGTSTTFLMSTPEYKPHPSYHFMNHPTTAGLYMFMLCYKNGGLAREHVRDAVNKASEKDSRKADYQAQSWDVFNAEATKAKPLIDRRQPTTYQMGLYFPRHEIVPNIPPGTWRFTYEKESQKLDESNGGHLWNLPWDDVRTIIESQMLSLRLRSRSLVTPQKRPTDPKASSDRNDESRQKPSTELLPPQPRRIDLVGGGSVNPAIARICGDVLGGAEGVYRLDIGSNACALGAAYKAVWAVERRPKETFEELVGERWNEEGFVKKVDDGYRKDIWEAYGEALPAFEEMENRVAAKFTNGHRQGGDE